jgi:hypothetical protein
MARGTHDSLAIQSRRAKDKSAALKLGRLMDNCGLSPEVLAAQTGVSSKQVRYILDTGHQPERRVRYALARRFDLLPAHVWKSDAVGIAPGELEHLLALARRGEGRMVA